MKDKNLPDDIRNKSLNELTELASNIIKSLENKKNLEEAGKNLYKTLRKIKRSKFKKIAVEKIPYIGLGQTINDRLKRASKR